MGALNQSVETYLHGHRLYFFCRDRLAQLNRNSLHLDLIIFLRPRPCTHTRRILADARPCVAWSTIGADPNPVHTNRKSLHLDLIIFWRPRPCTHTRHILADARHCVAWSPIGADRNPMHATRKRGPRREP